MSSNNPWDSEEENNPWNKNKNGSVEDNGFCNCNHIISRLMQFFSGDPSKQGFVKYFVGCAIIIYLLFGLFQVEHDERAVVLRFGRWVRTVGPGLNYVLPYPFESAIVHKVTTVNRIDIGKNQTEDNLMLTGDSNLANISFSVLWKIKYDGIEQYLFNARTPEITVKAVAESVMREIVGQTKFTYVQTEGRAEIQKKVLESLQALMNEYKMGIEIIRIDLQRVEPPASVVDSFRDVERAQAEQQSEKNKAEAYDRDKRARTRGIIAERLNIGESSKRTIIENAKSAVARFLSSYEQYKIAPDIVAKRIYIDSMKDIYKDINKIIIDSNLKMLPHLPIQHLSSKKGE